MSCIAQKIKFSIKYFFSKCDEIRRNLRIWSHLLKKSLMENFIFCAVLFLCLNKAQLHNFADDNTISSEAIDINEIIKMLEK